MKDLPGTMQAVRVHGPRDYRWEEVPVPRIGPGEVLTRVLATGVCASDVMTYLGARVWGSAQIAPYIETPVIAGHEFAGEVVELGEGAGERWRLAVDDRVVSEQIVPCGECRFCARGQYWMCQKHDIDGFKKDRAEGSWAQYMKYPARARKHKVPRSIPPEQAALIEPLACAIHAVERGDIQLGDVVVIAGMGPIGLCMMSVAKRKGAGMLVALDMKPHRLELARRFGADLAIDVGKADAVAEVLKLTDGYGCDVYIEASGAGPAIGQGLQMIRRLGTFVEFSVHAGPVSIDWSVIGDVKELTINGSHLGPYSYPLAIEYLAKGIVDGARLVSHQLPLREYATAIDIAHEGDRSIKVVLLP
jgi:threonine dehydrogenase-like Zn-dependent dehydrogenase